MGSKTFGILLAILIILVLNSNNVGNFVESRLVASQVSIPTDEIPLCGYSYPSPVLSNIADNARANHTGVPDYNALIFLNTNNVFEGQDEQIHVQINDTGILHMTDPYFFVLVFNQNNQLQYTFPCDAGDTYLLQFPSGWGDMFPNSGLIDGQYNTCNIGYTYFESNCISRLQLMNGYVSGYGLINYTFPADNSGQWKIYVFVFNDTYTSRPNISYCTSYNGGCAPPSFFSNSVASTEAEIQVSSGSPPVTSDLPSSISPLFVLQTGSSIFFGWLGYYESAKKDWYTPVKERYEKHKGFIRNMIALFIFTTVYTAFLFLLLR